MISRLLVLVAIAFTLSAALAQERRPVARFVPLEIYIDSGARSLAAYQFELKIVQGDVKIVGVENGEHPAFSRPPYYDPAALYRENRIIVGAFHTGSDLPAGRTRVATVHVRIAGDVEPEWKLDLQAAASTNGKVIEPKIDFQTGVLQ